jgi:hypothetical protein
MRHSNLQTWQVNENQNISLYNQTVIRNMELDETCKYMDTGDGDGIDNSQMKGKLVKERYRRGR